MELSVDQARRIAEIILESLALPAGDAATIVGDPIDFEGGWVFTYDSKKHVDTGELSYALAGNAPIAVLRNGEVRILGTAHPLEYYLDRLAE